MNTLDRYGNTLPTDIQPSIDYIWSARIAATNGVYNVTTGWTYWEVPAEAILTRSRSAELDGTTWQLSMSVLADALPPLVDPLSYYQLEVDLIDDAGNAWPYHSGPIDSVSESWSMDGGALVRVLEVTSFGTMQRAKGLDFNSLSSTPVRTSFAGLMTGMAEMQVVAVTGGVIGTPFPIPGTVHTVDITSGTGTYPAVVVSANSDFSSPKTYGAAADYTITNAAGTAAPTTGEFAYIKWVTAVPATYYVKFWTVKYWGIAQNVTAGRPAFIRVPGGSVTYTYGTTRIKRTIADDFATLAASGCTTTAITVVDPEPFKSGNALVAVSSGPTEYLEWTPAATGTPEVKQISSVSAAGVITVSPFSSAPVAGDLIRLVTTQQVRAWERHNRGSAQVSTNPSITSDALFTTEYAKGTFELYPQAGIMRPAAILRHWYTASAVVYASTIWALYDGTIALGSDNRLESFYYGFLGTAFGFYQSPTTTPAVNIFETGNPLLTYVKNLAYAVTSFDDVLEQVGKDGLPPNGYIHDRPSGGVLLSAFRQKTTPDLVLNNVAGVQISALPEPVTKVTVRCVGEERLITAELMPETGGTWTNPAYLFDGTSDTASVATATSGATVTVRLRYLDGSIFPKLTRVVIKGVRGIMEAYVERWDAGSTLARSRQVEGYGYNIISTNKDIVIDERSLNDAFASLAGFDTAEHRLVLKFYDNTLAGSLTSQVTEIQYFGRIDNGWSAFLSDDTTAVTGSAPTGWTTLNDQGFGTFYWTRDAGQARSFRYADPAYLKRVQPVYDAAWASSFYRREIIDLTRINQTEAKKIAESYLDEYVRQGRTYTVSALIDPRVDLGDTVNVTLGDGTSKDLFVWGIADDGNREDFMTTYTLLDYGA